MERSIDKLLRNPITGIAACCERAASGHAAAAPPSVNMNSRRRMWIAMRPLPLEVVCMQWRGRYHGLAKERIMLLRCESLEPPMSQLGHVRQIDGPGRHACDRSTDGLRDV